VVAVFCIHISTWFIYNPGVYLAAIFHFYVAWKTVTLKKTILKKWVINNNKSPNESWIFLMKFNRPVENTHLCYYRVFHGFGQAKFAYHGLILGLSQLILKPQLPLKKMLNLKVFKMD